MTNATVTSEVTISIDSPSFPFYVGLMTPIAICSMLVLYVQSKMHGTKTLGQHTMYKSLHTSSQVKACRRTAVFSGNLLT